MRRFIGILAAFLAAATTMASCGGGGEFPVQCQDCIKVSDPIVIRVGEEYSFKDCGSDASEVAPKIKVSPSFDFDVEFPDEGTLCIIPRERLKYNTSYTISAPIAGMCGFKGRTSRFEVRTLAPYVNVNFGPLTSTAEDIFSVEVCFTSDDILEGSVLEEGFKIRGQQCHLSWNHSEDGMNHTLTLDGIALQNELSELELRYDYPQYVLEGSRVFTLPPKGSFTVISSEELEEPYCIQVVFSAEVDALQDLDSFISMPGAGDLRFFVRGNVLKIYPSIKAEHRQFISIAGNLACESGSSLGEDYEMYFAIPEAEPYVKFITKGTILPSSEGMKLHFLSSNYAKVRVRVHRIYENNMLQYLQDNRLSGVSSYIEDVARVVADTTFALDEGTGKRLRESGEYALDISQIVKVQKGALYKVEIRGVDPLAAFMEEPWESDYYFGSYEDYRDRARNILATDLCAIAKASDDGDYTVYVTDLIAAKSVKGAVVCLYNSVNQLLGKEKTDSDGRCVFHIEGDAPRTAVITHGEDRTYMTLEEGGALSLSSFDVSGTALQCGRKGFIYGDRGVWRPGDAIHIGFISMIEDGTLPEEHPMTAILRNPDGQEEQRCISREGHNGMYAFEFTTSEDSPAGRWEVEVLSGASSFRKGVRIESVKPDNILINLTLADDPLVCADDICGTVNAKWLVGTEASSLETRVEVALSKGTTSFKGFEEYAFEDCSRSFEMQTCEIARGITDDRGLFSFKSDLNLSQAVPGLLDAVFTTRVFEKSGDFSIDRCSTRLSPYRRYIGINIPEKENMWGEKYLDIRKAHTLSIVALDGNGRPESGSVPVDVELYRIGWNWWWSSSEGYLASYSRDSYDEPYQITKALLVDGQGFVRLDFSDRESGFFFIRVVDPDGRHAASKVFMVCDDDENVSQAEVESAARLSIRCDKTSYKAGQKALVDIPSVKGSSALVSIEKGGGVMNSYWIECEDGHTVIPLEITSGMAPNVYVSITLIQPHATTRNDAPIRLFGVTRINVDDPQSRLEPLVEAPSKVRPQGKLTIKVREKRGRPMSYTLALVDEGLLSLTRFRTPDPWKAFYATEALGVRTWDLYNLVIGAYGARLEPMFAVGGDGSSELIVPPSGAERFKPVSIFLGPYTLKAGATGTHSIDIPQYIGQLRVMVVASDGHSQGSTEKEIEVTKPLMVKSTLPRILGTEEELSLPVTLFATKDNVGEVSVKVSSSGALSVSGPSTRKVSLAKKGDKVVWFNVKSSPSGGKGFFKVEAVASGDASTDEVEIEVRNPIPKTTLCRSSLLSSGESVEEVLHLAGEAGTNSASVEVSSIPPLNLGYRLNYLLDYPHDCLEQRVSSAFPLLYVGKLSTSDAAAISLYESRVKSVIASLPSYAVPSGGMALWRGDAELRGADVWTSIYTAHFLTEASKCGYAVPASLTGNCLSFVRKVSADKSISIVSRAYACFVLSLAGEPFRAQMNRLREEPSLAMSSGTWFLSAAYALDGRKDVARKLLSGLKPSSEAAFHWGEMGSADRDKALSAMVYRLLGDKKEAFKAVSELSSSLNDHNRYMSTQTLSWALCEAARYGSAATEGVALSLSTEEDRLSLRSDGCMASSSLKCTGRTVLSVKMKNESSAPLYVVTSSCGIPAKGLDRAVQNGLMLKVEYALEDGTVMDPSSIAQGTDFVIKAYVSNMSHTMDVGDIALTLIMPSGWEMRRDEVEGLHRDFRDDRVMSYFNLPAGGNILLEVRVTASYKGRFYLPASTCEAMYDGRISASTEGMWCEVK